MWRLSDEKLRISIKIRDKTIWPGTSLSLCLLEAGVRGWNEPGEAAAIVCTKTLCRRGGAQIGRSAFKSFRDNLS